MSKVVVTDSTPFWGVVILLVGIYLSVNYTVVAVGPVICWFIFAGHYVTEHEGEIAIVLSLPLIVHFIYKIIARCYVRHRPLCWDGSKVYHVLSTPLRLTFSILRFIRNKARTHTPAPIQ